MENTRSLVETASLLRDIRRASRLFLVLWAAEEKPGLRAENEMRTLNPTPRSIWRGRFADD